MIISLYKYMLSWREEREERPALVLVVVVVERLT